MSHWIKEQLDPGFSQSCKSRVQAKGGQTCALLAGKKRSCVELVPPEFRVTETEWRRQNNQTHLQHMGKICTIFLSSDLFLLLTIYY